jgi:uncharacterized protein (TIGR03435 family)
VDDWGSAIDDWKLLRPAWRSCLSALLASAFLLVVGCKEPPAPPLAPYQPTTPATRPAPREALITPTRDPAAEATVHIAEAAHTLTGVNLRIEDLISVAYRTAERPRQSIPLLSALRVVAAQPLPTGRYDVRLLVPGGKALQLRAALAGALEHSFGLTVRREMRPTAVLVLASPTAKLDVHPVVGSPPQPGFARLTLTGDDLSLLAEQLEECMQQPVVNESGLKGAYDLKLVRRIRDGQAQPVDVEIARQALRAQLGLDLTPALRSIEFLIVEKR